MVGVFGRSGAANEPHGQTDGQTDRKTDRQRGRLARRQADTGKSTLWTNTGQDRNFQRTLSAIGPYLFMGKFIWTNHWSIPFPGEIRMDQWS